MRTRNTFLIGTLLFAAFAAPSCVSKGTHQGTLDELSQLKSDLDSKDSELHEANAYIDQLKDQRYGSDANLAKCERSIRDSIRATQETSELLNGCRANLVAAHADLDATKNRHKRDEQQTAAERKKMEAERMKLIEQLDQLQAENRERERLYTEMRERLNSLISAGQLDVTLKNGRLVINMPQDILFGSGSADVGKEGQKALLQVANVLSEFHDRSFQVEGYTDNVPISTRQFPSNWELSAARALSVVRILQQGGVSADRLSGAGYGEYHPVASNDTKENRAKNRRIEIVILPNLKELMGETGD